MSVGMTKIAAQAVSEIRHGDRVVATIQNVGTFTNKVRSE